MGLEKHLRDSNEAMLEAADEITRLRAERDALRAALKGMVDALPSDESMRSEGREPGPLLVAARAALRQGDE